jgi:hypothetical protein
MPIIVILLGALDESTDLIVNLLNEVHAPLWVSTLIKILALRYVAFKLYYTDSKTKLKK